MARVYTSILSLFVVHTFSCLVWAQEQWPSFPLDGHRITRGPGSYFAWWKLLLIWVLFLIWVKTTDWVNKDSQILQLNHQLWNPIVFVPFLLTLLTIVISAPFPIGYTLLVLSWLVPLGVYIFKRNADVEDYQKVLTVDHFRHLASGAGKQMGVEIDAQKKKAHEKGAPVAFKALSGESTAKNEANMILARQSDGYVASKELIADSLTRRSTKIMLDTNAEEVTVRYQIDGVWHEADPLEREVGDGVVEVIKRLSDSDPEERRKRQTGEFSMQYQEHKGRAVMVSQGTKTGERTIVSMVQSKLPFDKMEDAGMRDQLIENLSKALAEPSGIILFSSIPGGGLSTTVALAGRMSDRYMRDFVSFQDVNKPETVAENISIENFDGKKDNVHEMLRTVIRKDPDVIIVHDLESKEVGELACEAVNDDKMIWTTMRAKEAVEALLRVLLLKIPAKAFAPLVHAVVNQRLVRKLCEECKEEYTPSPALLKKLGIPKDRVSVLYKPPVYEENDKPCKACDGLGYFGRTSVFEVLMVNDKIREALIKQPKLEVLRKVAKKSGHRGLQEEGILLVVKGVTSLEELTRVLKQ